jgi:hypothetical protein
MKKVILTLIFLIGILSGRFFALDIELGGGMGNLAFDKNRKIALSDPTEEGVFDPHYLPLIQVRLSGEYRSLFFNTGFERDPLLRNKIFGNVRAEFDYFTIEGGPFIGLFNSTKLPLNPGVSAALELAIPRITFIRAGVSSTFGTAMRIPGNYSQFSGSLSAGFWVPHVICSMNMIAKNYTSREDANLLTEDASVKYFFRADVFAKNVPYTVQIDMGFQNLSRFYNNGIVNDTLRDEYKLFFIGLEGTYTINPSMKLFLAGEMPVYSWGRRPMKDPPRGTFLFEGRAGIAFSLPMKT